MNADVEYVVKFKKYKVLIMLCRFEVENFKNFNKNFVFDLTDVKAYEFNPECIRNNGINNSLIYGPNGIGKSNLGIALFDIITHLTDKNKNIDFYNNYLNAESNNDIAEFKYKFKFNNKYIDYHYGKKNVDLLVYEHLFICDEKVISYDRRNTNEKEVYIDLEGAETLNRDLSQIQISVVKYVKSSTVLVSDEKVNILFSFFKFIDNMLLFASLEKRYYQGFETGNNIITEYIATNEKTKDFEKFLNKASIDCKLRNVERNEKKNIEFDFGKKGLDFWECSSTGTHSLTLYYFWLLRINAAPDRASLIFIDEFDAFYQSEVAELIIQELKGKEYQTILTTHNTSLMTNDLLRPDCYFLMYKTKMGALSSFTDKEIRKAHNIEKMYRAGAFNE